MKKELTPVSSAPMLTQKTVLLVDDHDIVRDGLIAVLQSEAGLRIVGVAATGIEAVSATRRLEPDVVVMDLILPQLSGIDAIERILLRRAQTQIVVVSACLSSEQVFRALRVGARAYLPKETAAAELVPAIRAVLLGRRYLSPRISAMVVEGMLAQCASEWPIERLSGRERQVLHLTVAGLSSAAIGKQMSLSRATVDTYRARLMSKLRLSDRTQLIHFAIEHALAPA
jgi:DNA-binding NarL/FixJ family response regulator